MSEHSGVTSANDEQTTEPSGDGGESLLPVGDVLRGFRELLFPLNYSFNGQLGGGEGTRIRAGVSIASNTNHSVLTPCVAAASISLFSISWVPRR